MTPAPRRFAPLYPGDIRRCPNGCPERAPGYEDAPRMPDWAPASGCWYTCCIFCGWVGRYVLRHGDREQDVYWVTDEDVPDEQAELIRTWGLRVRTELGMGLWPDDPPEA